MHIARDGSTCYGTSHEHLLHRTGPVRIGRHRVAPPVRARRGCAPMSRRVCRLRRLYASEKPVVSTAYPYRNGIGTQRSAPVSRVPSGPSRSSAVAAAEARRAMHRRGGATHGRFAIVPRTASANWVHFQRRAPAASEPAAAPPRRLKVTGHGRCRFRQFRRRRHGHVQSCGNARWTPKRILELQRGLTLQCGASHSRAYV